jgi:hypothetical protein
MTEFLILKLEGDDPRNAKVVAHVTFDGGPEEAIKQGYDGDGRYAIVSWNERLEANLAPGPAELSDVQDKAAREAVAAEEAAAEEVKA